MLDRRPLRDSPSLSLDQCLETLASDSPSSHSAVGVPPPRLWEVFFVLSILWRVLFF